MRVAFEPGGEVAQPRQRLAVLHAVGPAFAVDHVADRADAEPADVACASAGVFVPLDAVGREDELEVERAFPQLDAVAAMADVGGFGVAELEVQLAQGPGSGGRSAVGRLRRRGGTGLAASRTGAEGKKDAGFGGPDCPHLASAAQGATSGRVPCHWRITRSVEPGGGLRHLTRLAKEGHEQRDGRLGAHVMHHVRVQ